MAFLVGFCQPFLILLSTWSFATIPSRYSCRPVRRSSSAVFLQLSYEDVFNILMQDETIMSLMAPFKSAYDNKAMDQLEGMVGTLRVNAARLVSHGSLLGIQW